MVGLGCHNAELRPQRVVNALRSAPRTVQVRRSSQGQSAMKNDRQGRPAALHTACGARPAHDRVGDAQALQVARHRLEPLRVDLVGEDHAAVAHQRRDVRRLAACARRRAPSRRASPRPASGGLPPRSSGPGRISVPARRRAAVASSACNKRQHFPASRQTAPIYMSKQCVAICAGASCMLTGCDVVHRWEAFRLVGHKHRNSARGAPGAAAMSTICSPSCGASAMTGRNDAAPCSM